MTAKITKMTARIETTVVATIGDWRLLTLSSFFDSTPARPNENR